MKKLLLFASCFLIFYGCSKEKSGIALQNMDLKADPAQDFYQYANGGWLKNNKIPESENGWNAFGEIRDANKKALLALLKEVSAKENKQGTNAQKVGDFYKTGMDTVSIEKSGIAPLKNYFDEIDAVKNIDDVVTVAAKQQQIGAGSLFTLFVDGDFKDSKRNTVYLYQAGLGMPDRDYYFEKGETYDKYRSEYLKHLKKMFEFMGDDSVKANLNAAAVNKIETQLAEASWTKTALSEYTKWYNKRTIEEANKETPNIKWDKYFETIGVKNPAYFIIAQPDFFAKLSGLLEKESIEDWKTYLRWHLINATAPYLSSKFVNQDFYFYQTVLMGTKELKPRWKRIAESTDAALGEALGQLYVEKHFPQSAKIKANEIVNNLRLAYRERIKNLDWMSAETKKQAFKKLDKLVQKIGFPDKWRDYSQLEISKDSYVQNVMRAIIFEFNRNMKKVGKLVDKSEWGLTPPTVNAYYHPINNEIVFPAGILQPPFFNPDADDAVNYGAMGMIIGHEITHGYDDQGRQFNSEGNMADWWTEKDKQLFDAKTKVIEEQFSKYVVLDSVNINGKLTLGENIADLGGLSVAFDALQIALTKSGKTDKLDGFTPEQRFFISYASIWHNLYRDDALLNQVKTDPHTPAYFRVIGPLSNFPPFFEAFNIKPGDKMRRPDSLLAKVW
ncbi:MAG: M13 family metallopeptidase [Ignavibacteria bacterium]|nr:M13 family metallopeptidase [Ignavibacteria bacterium]